jgi:hypothetical protein
MKVKELIEMLAECDEDAEVYLMSQSGWPFEMTVHGVAVREDFAERGDEDESDEGSAAPARDRWTALDSKLPGNDVFIVEGQQTRYGSSEAWNAARRR